MIHKFRAPTIHLNGTSKTALVDSITEARAKLWVAFIALQDASPNARDYYPQGDYAYIEAQKSHRAALQKISEIYDGLGKLVMDIDIAGT